MAEARQLAADIVQPVQSYILEHSTVSVERTVLRLYGVDGVDAAEVPYPNLLVDDLVRSGKLESGVSRFYANALLQHEGSPDQLWGKIASGEQYLTDFAMQSDEQIRAKLNELSSRTLAHIERQRHERDRRVETLGLGRTPLLYAIVATGNIYEDVTQAISSVRQGGDIIAVIRSTAQSLIDYVPYGATTEGYGGTYATQENFRIMRKALDEEAPRAGRYLQLTNYSSGLCMAEIAAMAATERLDMLLNDAMYGILFRDINMCRTFIDQYFSRMIIAWADITINTGEDNYLTTADAYEEAHTVLSSQFINENFALQAGMKTNRMGLGHAFEMNPDMTDGFLWELAQAQLVRQCFPDAPLKYMPPTRHKTGNIFKGHLMDGLHSLISQTTNQGIHLIGVLTEAIHTPWMSDRYLALENSRYMMNNCRHLGDEIEFKAGGRIETRALETLEAAVDQLRGIREKGMFRAIEERAFAGVKRTETSGRGYDGVFRRAPDYLNVIEDQLRSKLALGGLKVGVQ